MTNQTPETTTQDDSEYSRVKDDVLKALKERELTLFEDYICPLIEAAQADTAQLLADQDEVNDAMALVEQGGTLAENWAALVTAVMAEVGWLSDKGEPTEKMPGKFRALFEQMATAHKEFNTAVEEFETEEEESE